jgi:hypothetical protein
MKKFVKLSLAAAVATAGLTSANAGSLEEAIKGVNVFGYANLRYNSYNAEDGAANSNTQNVYHKVVLGINSKINDDFSYTYAGAVLNGNTDTTNATGTNYLGGEMHSVYSYFTYTGLENVTMTIGQSGIDTPFTDLVDTYGSTQEGNGITASTSYAGVNLFAGWYAAHNLGLGDNGANLTALAASTKIGNVNVDATYVDIKDSHDGYSVGAKTTLDLDGAKLSPFARYSSLETEAEVESVLWYVGSTFSIGTINGKLAYGATDKDAANLAGDNDAEAAFLGWNLTMNGYSNGTNTGNDQSMIQAQLNTNLTPTVNAAIQYNEIDRGNDDTTDEESFVTITYKPSKNLTTYVRGGVDTIGNKDNTRGRIQLTYTF